MELKIKYIGCGEWSVGLWYHTDCRQKETIKGIPQLIAWVVSNAIEIYAD